MKALVLGTAGIQITVPIEKFPYDYRSVFLMDDKMKVDVAGVGYSSIKILQGLGDQTTMLTGIGNDFFGGYIEDKVRSTGADCLIDRKDKESLVSVILYDDDGNRSILREGRMDYKYVMNPDTYASIDWDYDMAIFTLAGFSKALVPIASDKGITIATDMQTVDNLTNDYGKVFMDHSDIIFFSNDHYHGDLHDLVGQLYVKHQFKIIGVGLGKEGCLLCADGHISHHPSVAEEVVNTVGAGDALFSSFLHFYGNGDKPETAINKALYFVAEKIKYKTASEGFMDKETFLMRYGDRS